MSQLKIEDYGLIGDLRTAALVGRNGSIDWFCSPQFDSPACFAALLGDERHGSWRLAPQGEPRFLTRRYRPGTLILETDLAGDGGAVRLIDFMPVQTETPVIVRIVEGLRGAVAMQSRFMPRFDYGSLNPWLTSLGESSSTAIAGPDGLAFHTSAGYRHERGEIISEFEITAGQRVAFMLTWFPSHEKAPMPVDAFAALDLTASYWQEWSGRCRYQGEWREAVQSSLMALKAMTYAPTGALVAAPTASLPETIGGVRNWDYRYCWLRDAAFTLLALMQAGYVEEARAFYYWAVRATAGDPKQIQIMYGIHGERRLTEAVLNWLPGYEGSQPVHIGNAASNQFQLDVFGEVAAATYFMRNTTKRLDPAGWRLTIAAAKHLEGVWREPDEGIWEVRGPRRHFTHSKVMAWLAFDRAVKTVEQFGVEGPVDDWRRIRDEIHEDVCRNGFDPKRNTFTQYYGSQELDASLLLIARVGFLPPTDDRVRGTVDAIQRELTRDGFVDRYSTAERHSSVDGLPGVEGGFLPCSFWLVENLALIGRVDEARRLFERLLSLRNDLGLISEEYDPIGKRMLGNFPQAFTHLALVNAAYILSAHAASSIDDAAAA